MGFPLPSPRLPLEEVTLLRCRFPGFTRPYCVIPLHLYFQLIKMSSASLPILPPCVVGEASYLQGVLLLYFGANTTCWLLTLLSCQRPCWCNNYGISSPASHCNHGTPLNSYTIFISLKHLLLNIFVH